MDFERARVFLSRLSVKHRDLNVSVPFIMNPNQQVAFRLIAEQYAKTGQVRACVLKARRVGMSSLMDALLWVHTVAKPQAHAQIIAHLKDVSAKGLFRVPRDLASELNEKVRFPVCDVRAQEIRTAHSDGESLLDISTAGSVGGGRGLTLTALHLSEAASYPGQDSFLSILPAVAKAPDTMIVLESTAQGRTGIGKVFYEHWLSAKKGHGRHWNGYVPIFLSWLDDPACIAAAHHAKDAPATDLERELMSPPFNANRSQIAWMRLVLEGECQGSEMKFCIASGERVSTQMGIHPIQESISEVMCESGRVSAVHDNGWRPIVQVTTQNGYRLRCTHDHEILTVRHGFVQASLSTNHRIRLGQYRFSVGDEIDESTARFLGYFVTDGSLYIAPSGKAGVVVSLVGDQKDLDVRDILRLDFEHVVGRLPQSRKFGHSNCWELRLTCKAFVEQAKSLGVFNEERPHRKVCVPESIFRSSRSVVREFLRGAFEGDGSASANMVRLYSKYPEFLRDVQLLLLGFGITCKRDGSWLLLRGEEAEAFHESVGFLGKRKNSTVSKFKRNGLGSNIISLTLTDRVLSVEPCGQSRVYDLTIEPTHHYVASGFMVHNCQEYPHADHVAFVATGDPAFSPTEIKYAFSTRVEDTEFCQCDGKVKCSRPHRGILQRSGGLTVFRRDPSGPWRIYETPTRGCFYYLGVDCARGMEEETGRATGDFSAIVAYNGTTGNIAARFAEWADPEDTAEQCDLVGRWYNKSMMNIELTGNLGLWCMKRLRDSYHYPNFYRWKGKDDKALRPNATHPAICWETNTYSRKLMFASFRASIRAGMRNIPGGLAPKDAELIDQMDLCTMSNAGRFDVEKGHDDVLFAAMIAVIACDQWPPPNILSFKHNVMENPEEARAAALAHLNPQSDLQLALKRDFREFSKPERESRLSRNMKMIY